MVKLTEYEKQRQQRIEDNKKRVEELFGGIDPKTLCAKPEPRKTVVSKKRKAQVRDESNTESEAEDDVDSKDRDKRPRKVSRNDMDTAPESGPVRRSSRLSGKKAVDYNAEQDRSARTAVISKRARATMKSEPRYENKRVHDPKQYGHIPGVKVGDWWETREACSTAAIHAPWVAGIAPGPKGAYSIALSGGYDDDIDLGYGFTYTGSGGRDLKGTKDKPKNLRTAPQSSDQTFENNFNKSLLKSSETKKPIRVIRGYKLQSPFTPAEGYRYDGLYIVEQAWIEPGNNPGQYKVCKYTFKRLPDQPALPTRATDEEDEDEDEEDVEEDEDGESEAQSDSAEGDAETDDCDNSDT